MRVCEICGIKEEMEQNVEGTIETVVLHVCKSCQEDRKWHTFDPLE
jgi:ribosome-binding protein aMBF1 (putative translation factor)